MPEGISPLDIALALPFLWAAIRGVRKGLIMEVTGLVALFLGAYAALFFSDLAAHWLDAEFAIGEAYLGITAFAVTWAFCTVQVLCAAVVTKTAITKISLASMLFSLRNKRYSSAAILLGDRIAPPFIPSHCL